MEGIRAQITRLEQQMVRDQEEASGRELMVEKKNAILLSALSRGIGQREALDRAAELDRADTSRLTGARSRADSRTVHIGTNLFLDEMRNDGPPPMPQPIPDHYAGRSGEMEETLRAIRVNVVSLAEMVTDTKRRGRVIQLVQVSKKEMGLWAGKVLGKEVIAYQTHHQLPHTLSGIVQKHLAMSVGTHTKNRCDLMAESSDHLEREAGREEQREPIVGRTPEARGSSRGAGRGIQEEKPEGEPRDLNAQEIAEAMEGIRAQITRLEQQRVRDQGEASGRERRLEEKKRHATERPVPRNRSTGNVG
ncbi:hypothetical protein ACLB2K_016912 [Fragaria x ananassa]